jgi:hypothetical protein
VVDGLSRTGLGLTARSRCNRAMASPLSAREAIFVDPRLLAQAPELATLALLDVALELSVRALLAEHQTLELKEPGLGPSSLRRAQRVLTAVCPLQRAVRRYREAVIAATRATTKQDDDLPF